MHTCRYLLDTPPQGISEDKAKTRGEWAEHLCGSHRNGEQVPLLNSSSLRLTGLNSIYSFLVFFETGSHNASWVQIQCVAKHNPKLLTLQP